MFCSQICTLKLNLLPKIGLAISIVKWFFWILSKKIFFTSFCWIWIIDGSQQYCENFRKIEQAELVENLPPKYLPYKFLHNLHSFLLWEKVKIFDFLKNIDWNKTFCAKVVNDKWFCIKSWQKFANLLLYKAPSKKKKNNFLKDVESTVVF